MRKSCFLVLLMFGLFALFSCQKDGTTKPVIDTSEQTLIIGKWNLQKQNTVVMVNNIKMLDTSYAASADDIGSVTFGKSGTYSSSSFSRSPGSGTNLGTGGIVSQDSTTGVYGFPGNKFTMSTPGVAGFGTTFAYIGTTTGASEIPKFNLLSYVATITQLTSSNLGLHVEVVYTETDSNGAKTYQTGQDYYYTR